jgi:hypothetical protein
VVLQLDAFRRVCRADEGPLAGAEARALHSTLDVAARQAAIQKTLTVRGAMRAQVHPNPPQTLILHGSRQPLVMNVLNQSA